MFNLAPADIPISIVTFLVFVAIGAIWDLANEPFWEKRCHESEKRAGEVIIRYQDIIRKYAPHALKPRDAKGRWLK